MVWAFDTLGYAKRLRDGGVPNPQAESHAEAAREFINTVLSKVRNRCSAAVSFILWQLSEFFYLSSANTR